MAFLKVFSILLLSVLSLTLSSYSWADEATEVEAAFQKLLTLDHRPSIQEVKQAFGSSIDSPLIDFNLIKDHSPSNDNPFAQNEQLAIAFTDGPRLLATIEKMYPGALFFGMGRDSAFLVDLFDAYYHAQGQPYRVGLLEIGRYSFGQPNLLVEYLKQKGLRLPPDRRDPFFVIFDATSFGSDSQSTKLLRAITHYADQNGISRKSILSHISFFNTGYRQGMYKENLIPDRASPDGKIKLFSQMMQDNLNKNQYAAVPSLDIPKILTYGLEYTDSYGALTVDGSGKVQPTIGKVMDSNVRRKIITAQIHLIRMTKSPEFRQRVELTAKNNFLFQIPEKSKLSLRERQEIRGESLEFNEQTYTQKLGKHLDLLVAKPQDEQVKAVLELAPLIWNSPEKIASTIEQLMSRYQGKLGLANKDQKGLQRETLKQFLSHLFFNPNIKRAFELSLPHLSSLQKEALLSVFKPSHSNQFNASYEILQSLVQNNSDKQEWFESVLQKHAQLMGQQLSESLLNDTFMSKTWMSHDYIAGDSEYNNFWTWALSQVQGLDQSYQQIPTSNDKADTQKNHETTALQDPLVDRWLQIRSHFINVCRSHTTAKLCLERANRWWADLLIRWQSDRVINPTFINRLMHRLNGNEISLLLDEPFAPYIAFSPHPDRSEAGAQFRKLVFSSEDLRPTLDKILMARLQKSNVMVEDYEAVATWILRSNDLSVKHRRFTLNQIIIPYLTFLVQKQNANELSPTELAFLRGDINWSFPGWLDDFGFDSSDISLLQSEMNRFQSSSEKIFFPPNFERLTRSFKETKDRNYYPYADFIFSLPNGPTTIGETLKVGFLNAIQNPNGDFTYSLQNALSFFVNRHAAPTFFKSVLTDLLPALNLKNPAHMQSMMKIITHIVQLNLTSQLLEICRENTSFAGALTSLPLEPSWGKLPLQIRLIYNLSIRDYNRVEERFSDFIYYLPKAKLNSFNSDMIMEWFKEEGKDLSEYQLRTIVSELSYRSLNTKLTDEQYVLLIQQFGNWIYALKGESVYQWPELRALISSDHHFRDALSSRSSSLKAHKAKTGICQKALSWF